MRELLHEIRERRSSIRIKTLKQIQKCLEINPRIHSNCVCVTKAFVHEYKSFNNPQIDRENSDLSIKCF